jgi:hypothetical protein
VSSLTAATASVLTSISRPARLLSVGGSGA